MMKKFLKLTLAVVFIFGASSASAQKLGRVDLAAIVPNMPEYTEAVTNLETLGKELSLQLEQMNVELNNKYADYEKNVSTFSDTVRQMKEQELMDMQQRLQGMQQIAQQDLQNQLEQIQVEFNTLLMNYEKNASTMSESIRQLKEQELGQLQQRYQDFQQIAQQDMQRKEAELMNPIYDKANEAVKKVASEGGYTAIFSTAGDQAASAGLAYFDPAQVKDITADVKKELGIQ